jgi:hypothetical protein
LEGGGIMSGGGQQQAASTKIKTKAEKDRMVIQTTQYPNRGMGPEIRDREILVESSRQEVNDMSVTQSNAESNEIQN